MDFSQFSNFVWGENNISFSPPRSYIIKISHPHVIIRFNSELAMFASFDEFYRNVAEVNVIQTESLTDQELESILIDAWNFLALEERRLESDLDEFDEDLG